MNNKHLTDTRHTDIAFTARNDARDDARDNTQDKTR
ncbi:hypothetical protein MNBD_GAMMA10-3258 [hydrothermal vent metagenome]|uniref:Uncharacterized protein n=1 Tax=hydrothermal vent metagenome TaxID=652676 RepID=A0A3B0XR49_9ZZZZ